MKQDRWCKAAFVIIEITGQCEKVKFFLDIDAFYVRPHYAGNHN